MLVFAEITTRLHLASADERLLVVVAVWMIRRMMSVFYQTEPTWGPSSGPLSDERCMVLATPNRLAVSSAVRAQSLSAGRPHTWKPLCCMWWSCRRRDCMLLMILLWWPIKQIPMRRMSLKQRRQTFTAALITSENDKSGGTARQELRVLQVSC